MKKLGHGILMQLFCDWLGKKMDGMHIRDQLGFCRGTLSEFTQANGTNQNARHSEGYFIKTTVYDALNRLREGYVGLRREGDQKVTAAQIARKFDKVSHMNEKPVKQAATHGDRLDPLVTEELGHIMEGRTRNLLSSSIKYRALNVLKYL